MKTTLLIASLVSFFLQANSTLAEDTIHYPITHNADIARMPDNFDGEPAAIKVKVTEIQQGIKNKPYIRATFSDGETIWLAPLVNTNGYIAVDDIIHVLGYVSKLNESLDGEVTAYNKTGIHFLSICYYNFTTGNEIFTPFKSQSNQCTRWRDGLVN